ncbi:integrase core domain-containing protein [Tessaracoccus sp. MC1627]|uniref:integrase core domain-containing protein n=1 Tax=Tessaracoccus sp. MC1627 TaxID=2760312 RepID=UPI00351C01DD
MTDSVPGPRAGGPTRRRVFTPAEKLSHLAAYDAASQQGQGGAYLRAEGLYSSHMTEWRRLRDAGILEGKAPGQKVGRPSKDQTEIARLRRELDLAQRRLARTKTALDIMGKAHALLEDISESGGDREAAQHVLMGAYDDLIAAGTTTRDAATLTGVPRSTATRRHDHPTLLIREPTAPVNALSKAEREHVLEVLNTAEFVDQSPTAVYATLLARGQYLCSPATMYRILAANAQVKERRRQARHPARARPELTATGPAQVYSWDITKLHGPVKGSYFDAYVMIDIYSRYIVGAHVHTHESGPLAEEMIKEVFGVHGVHADRGTSKTVATLLADLHVTRSHSRPHVSNDNPYSEAWFKTLKYAPAFPDRFGTLGDARAFLTEFVDWYNHAHQHAGIGLHTPADVHYGLASATQARRSATLAEARTSHPERFTTTTDPKILNLPQTVWINQPEAPPPAAA